MDQKTPQVGETLKIFREPDDESEEDDEISLTITEVGTPDEDGEIWTVYVDSETYDVYWSEEDDAWVES